MFITQINTSYNNNNTFNSQCNLSFKMRMSELGNNINKFVAKKYKINPQPIKTLTDFQEYCKNLAKDIAEKNFGGRQEETKIQRKAILKDWYDYIVENGAYTGAMMLMIMAGITAGLKPNEDKIPPALNKGVLADTVTDIQEKINNLKPNEEAQINFNKEYRLKIQQRIFDKETALDENLNGWIVIPSKNHDPENFKANVDKLKALSHNDWCTKSFNAEPSLCKGDFHVYMEAGKPKLGIRFNGDIIQEIQGEKNNLTIPFKYGDIVKEHIQDYKLTDIVKKEINSLEEIKAEIEEIKAKFPNGINNASAQEILDALKIKYKQDDDGLLIISHYGSPNSEYSYSDLGIDENKLLQEIKSISGDAYFQESKATSLGKLKSIGGSAYFKDSKITDLVDLQYICGDVIFSESKITSLGKLQSIGGNAYFKDSKITSLGELQSIGGDAYFKDSKITSLGKLKSIGGSAYFKDLQITSLGELQSIGGGADFSNSQIKDLGELQSIGGSVWIDYSQITSLGKLKSIGGNASFMYSQITDLGDLQSIGGSVFIANSKLKKEDFASIKIGKKISTIFLI